MLPNTIAGISGSHTNTSTSIVSSSSSKKRKRESNDLMSASLTSRTKKQCNSHSDVNSVNKDSASADMLGMYCNVLKCTVTTLTCFALYLFSFLMSYYLGHIRSLTPILPLLYISLFFLLFRFQVTGTTTTSRTHLGVDVGEGA